MAVLVFEPSRRVELPCVAFQDRTLTGGGALLQLTGGSVRTEVQCAPLMLGFAENLGPQQLARLGAPVATPRERMRGLVLLRQAQHRPSVRVDGEDVSCEVAFCEALLDDDLGGVTGRDVTHRDGAVVPFPHLR